MVFAVKRIYEPAGKADGCRVLVDRRWPRGLDKQGAALDGWLRELSPSASLRRWFGGDVARWESFRHRYAAELDHAADYWRPLVQRASRRRVTLLHAARDEEHNHAVALKIYLENWLRTHGPG